MDHLLKKAVAFSPDMESKQAGTSWLSLSEELLQRIGRKFILGRIMEKKGNGYLIAWNDTSIKSTSIAPDEAVIRGIADYAKVNVIVFFMSV